MKKITAMLLAFLILMPAVSLAQVETVAKQELTILFSFGSRSGIYTGEIKDGMPEGYGCFRSQNENGDVWIYAGDFSNGTFNGSGETMWANSQYEYGNYKDGVLADGLVFRSDGSVEVVGDARAILSKDSKTDANETINTALLESLWQLIERYDFSGAIDLINTEITPSKQTQELLLLLKEGNTLLEKCNVHYDSIADATTVTRKDVSSISESIHVYPRIENAVLYITFGFVREDWIFFDRIYYSGDNIQSRTMTVKAHTDVLDGGLIKEWFAPSKSEDEINIWLSAENPVVRFENRDNDKYVDYPVSAAEVDAMRILLQLRQIYNQLRDLLK